MLNRFHLGFALVMVMAGPVAVAAAPMSGDGAGCSDREVAARLIAVPLEGPDYIQIWAKGMQDGSCRGYGKGQEVTVDEEAEDMSCVRASDDQVCFWVAKDMAPQ